MEIQLKIIGLLLTVLAGIHIAFPRYFQWKTELRSLSLINRQMIYTHTFFIALTVLLMGLLCWCCGQELLYTDLGKKIAYGMSFFWGTRLFFQLFVYSPGLWRGKVFETAIHLIFTLFWTYLCIFFLLIGLR